MENYIIEEWDLRGWMGKEEPTPYVQREWNKTLIHKIMFVSNKIQRMSMIGGADTIRLHPDLEVILHPDIYDDFRKKLYDINVVLDDSMEKGRIEIINQQVLDNLKGIFIRSKDEETITVKKVEDCSEEEILNYLGGLVGYIQIENI